MPKEEVILYSAKNCRVIKIEILNCNGLFYYGSDVNLDNYGSHCGSSINCKSRIANSRIEAINKALDFILDYFDGVMKSYCRSEQDIDYLQHKIDIVYKYKKEFNSKNIQLTLF